MTANYATPADVTAAKAAMWPVGSIFLSVVSTDPATLLGFGTWSAIAAGRVLVGLNSGDTDFDTVEETGGSKTVSCAGSVADHVSHTHTYTDVPNHVHVQHTNTATTGATGTGVAAAVDTSTSGDSTCWFSTSNPTGGVATGTTAGPSATLTHTFTPSATSVVQPYFVCYMWKRTA